MWKHNGERGWPSINTTISLEIYIVAPFAAQGQNWKGFPEGCTGNEYKRILKAWHLLCFKWILFI